MRINLKNNIFVLKFEKKKEREKENIFFVYKNVKNLLNE